jgi:phospholipase C
MTVRNSTLFLMFCAVSLLCGCAGIRSGAAPTPTPTPTPGSLQSVNHIIFMMQENRSFDAYFGKMDDFRASQGLGRDADDLEASYANPADDGSTIATFHLPTSCIFNTTAAWLESWGDMSRFGNPPGTPLLLNGFVHTAGGLASFDGDPDTKGVRSMGFYTGADLNSPYFFATQFATSDRWYTPAPMQTEAVRLYSMAATSQGLVHPPSQTNAVLNATTIFQLLDKAGISWKIYSVNRQSNGLLITTLRNFQPYVFSVEDHIVPIDQFFADMQAGSLPSFSYIEPGFLSGTDEHPGKTNNITAGAAFMNKILTSLISSPSWKDSIFIESFDEGGGLFDHVSPMIDGQPIQELHASLTGQAVGPGNYSSDANVQHVPNPDGIQPGRDLGPNDPAPPAADFTRTGFRVPLIIVSPFAKPHYVSHTPMDYTAVLKFVEERFNLPNLNKRDAAQADMSEFFDFVNAPNMNPPSAPAQNLNVPCNALAASAPSGGVWIPPAQ